MRLPRLQFQIRWLMAAVAVLAILLSLSWAWWVLWLSLVLVMSVVAFGLFVLLPTALAPRNHRVEVAYWAIALRSVDVYSLVRDLAVFVGPPGHCDRFMVVGHNCPAISRIGSTG